MTWIIKVKEAPPEEKAVPSLIYTIPLIGGILLAIAKKRRR